jgi:hypothetical protein
MATVARSSRNEIIWKRWDLMLAGEYTPAEIRSLETTVFGLEGVSGGNKAASVKPYEQHPIFACFLIPAS